MKQKSRFKQVTPETFSLMVGWAYGFCAGVVAMLVLRSVL